MVETQILKTISFSSRRMVNTSFVEHASQLLNTFSSVCFYQSLQRKPVTSIQNFSSATITAEWLYFTILFQQSNCSLHSHMAIIWDTSLADFLARYKPINSFLSNTEDRFVGLFSAWLFILVVAESSYRTDYQGDWTQLLLPYSFSSNLLWRTLWKMFI